MLRLLILNLFFFCGPLRFLAAELTTATNEILDNGKNILDKMKDFEYANLDSFAEFKLINFSKTKSVRNLIHPIALFAGQIANLIILPESEERKVLKQINEMITKNFIEIPQKIRHELLPSEKSIYFMNYLIQVNVRLDDIRTHLSFILNPSFGEVSYEFFDEFERKCNKDLLESPWKILQTIEKFILCENRTPEESFELYFGIKKLFNTIFNLTIDTSNKNSEWFPPIFGDQYKRIFELKNNATNFILKIQKKIQKNKQRSFQNIIEARKFLDQKINEEEKLATTRQESFGKCLLDEFMNKNDWKTTNASLSLAINIQTHINLAAIIGSFCIGIEHKKNEELLKEKTNKFANLVNKISNHVLNRTIELIEQNGREVFLLKSKKIGDLSG